MPEIPVSIRLNPFKAVDAAYLCPDAPVPWCGDGLYLKERPSFTLDPLFHAGAYYVQDASAMMVGWMLRKVLESRFSERKTINVLDLCAAPGGKTTDAAAALRRQFGAGFLLVANEVIRQRAGILKDNVARWGDPGVVVTSSDPSSFAALKEKFDIIIADVPCSGEGMFRKSENAREMFSEENVALCAARQKRIIADVWPALAPGGVLIYSTCTFPKAENDDNVEWIASEFDATPLAVPELPCEGPELTKYGVLMHPEKVRGEGQYCAALLKSGTVQTPAAAADETVEFFEKQDEIFALPSYVARQMPFIGKALSVLSAGTHAFSVKGRDKIPAADLALSLLLDPEDFPAADLSREDALKYLHRDAIILPPDAPLGYVLVCYEGLPLGFVKNLGRRTNSLLPMHRRILMDVK